MDEITMDDEKTFEAEEPMQVAETEPDLDEHLILDPSNQQPWIVKIPRHLMEAWSSIDSDDVHLATFRVYPRESGEPYITMHLPPDPVTGARGEEFEMERTRVDVQNEYVLAEREKTPGSRARTSVVKGQVKAEYHVKQRFDDRFRERVRVRSRIYERMRSTKKMEESVSGGQGMVNMLSSGLVVPGFSDLVATKQRPLKAQFERMFRVPRNQLFDMLFELFRESPQWSTRVLREHTQQPEAYLKEVLNEIAFLHRSGESSGLWELKPSFKDDGVEAESIAGPSMCRDPVRPPWSTGSKLQEENGHGANEEDDVDMEEVF